jgi:7-cyano-7-deazaguanine synthase
MKALIVLSGGMDSATALAWAINNPDTQVIGALSFWYGSKHNDREWEAAQLVASHYNVPIKRVRLDFIAESFKSDLLLSGDQIPEGHYADPSMKKTVVPFRNGIMLSIAAGYAESVNADAIVLGNHFGDHAIYPDCRVNFIGPMSDAIKQGTYAGIELISPFSRVDKTEIAYLGSVLGVPYALTYSCYKGGVKHCGKCGTCVERKEAFEKSGVSDPTEYEGE